MIEIFKPRGILTSITKLHEVFEKEGGLTCEGYAAFVPAVFLKEGVRYTREPGVACVGKTELCDMGVVSLLDDQGTDTRDARAKEILSSLQRYTLLLYGISEDSLKQLQTQVEVKADESNPIAAYYCSGDARAWLAALAEITNTQLRKRVWLCLAVTDVEGFSSGLWGSSHNDLSPPASSPLAVTG